MYFIIGESREIKIKDSPSEPAGLTINYTIFCSDIASNSSLERRFLPISPEAASVSKVHYTRPIRRVNRSTA
jgi:hypothetical protein